MKISELKENTSNPRFIKDAKFKKLVNSIIMFPKMMLLRPIVYDKDKINLGGNMRQKAILEIKRMGQDKVSSLLSESQKEANIELLEPIFKGNFPEGWTRCADDLTEDEKKEFIIKDNVGFGSWNMDILANEWDEDLLVDWGMDLDFSVEDEEKEDKDMFDQIKLSYKIEIDLPDEKTQEETYNKLIKEGYECRILTL